MWLLPSPLNFTLTEGGTGTLTLVLSDTPRADVTVRLTVPFTTGGNVTVSPAVVTFPANVRSSGLRVTVTAVNDNIAYGGNYTSSLAFALDTTDTRLTRGTTPTVALTIADNDRAGCVTTLSGASILEGGLLVLRSALQSQPLSPVTLSLTLAETVSSLAADAALVGFQPPVVAMSLSGVAQSTMSVRIAPGDWGSAIVVNISSVNDFIAGPATRSFVVTSTLASADGLYSALGTCGGGSFTVLDDDHAGLALTPATVLVSEDPSSTFTSASYTLQLKSMPLFDVVVSLQDTTTPAKVTLSASSVTISPANWNVPVTVTVTAIADNLAEAPQTTTNIAHVEASNDVQYSVGSAASLSSLPSSNLVRVTVLEYQPGVVVVVDSTPAPLLSSAAISDVANAITLQFDRPTNLGGMAAVTASYPGTTCASASLFSSATMQLFDGAGDGSVKPSNCTWPTNSTLVVTLDAAAPALASWAGVVSVSLRGGNIRANNASIVFSSGAVVATPRTPVPALTSAQFADSGASVVVTFDRPSSGVVGTGSSGRGPCTSVFTNTNLGAGAMCAWTSPTTMTVTFGFATASLILPMTPFIAGASCQTSTSLTLAPGAVTAVVGGVLSSSGCVNIAPPNNPPVPTVTILGATSLGLCAPLTLDGSSSTGGGGRAMTYAWSVAGLNTYGATSATNLQAAANGVPLNNLMLVVSNSTLLVADAVINVTLTVQNFMGAAAAASVTVTIAGNPLPNVAIVSDPSPTLLRAQALTLPARGSVSSCAGTGDGRSLQYLWFLTSYVYDAAVVDPSYVTPLAIDNAGTRLGDGTVSLAGWVTNDPTQLKVPANTLQPGVTYVIAVIGRMTSRPTVNVRMNGWEWSGCHTARCARVVSHHLS